MAQGGWQVWVWEVAQISWRTGNQALDVKELEASSAWAQGKVQEWMISLYRQSLYCCASASLLLPQVVSSHQMRADASEFPRYYLSGAEIVGYHPSVEQHRWSADFPLAGSVLQWFRVGGNKKADVACWGALISVAIYSSFVLFHAEHDGIESGSNSVLHLGALENTIGLEQSVIMGLIIIPCTVYLSNDRAH